MNSISPAKKEEDSLGAGMLETAVLELLASRICHDLISPVGAVHNGVEFLQETGVAGNADAVGLIAHSAQMAAAKLQAFRLAYGAGGRDPNIKPADVHKVFADLIGADGKVKQDWDPKAVDVASMPAGFCKMLMGTLLLAIESLPRGGMVRVHSEGAQAHITAEGQDAGPRPQVVQALARELAASDLDPRLVHPYVLSVLAGQYGFSITIGKIDEGKVIYILQPAAA